MLMPLSSRLLTLTTALLVTVASSSAFAVKPAETKSTETKSTETKSTETKIVFDPAASVVKWTGKKVTGQHDGEIKLKSGFITMKGEELTGGEMVFDMASISNTDLKDPAYNKKLVTHLSSEDFFDVSKYPTSTLKVKKAVSVHGITGPTYEVTGDLTMKNKTNEVKFPVMIKTKDGKTTATANVTVDRTKWEIKYGSGKFFQGLGDKMINDTFVVDVALSTK